MSAPPLTGLSRIVLPMIGFRSPKQCEVAVLVSYLDDPGTDDQTICVTLAGFVSTLENWQAFERQAKEVMDKYGVSYLRGRDFWATDGDYANKGDNDKWDYDRKLAFVRDLNAVLAPNVGMALTHSVLKPKYAERQKVVPIKKQSAFGFAFEMTFHHLLKDEGFMDVVKEPGVNLSWIIEQGNANNAEIVQRYERLLEAHKGNLPYFGGMALAPKNSTIAIQVADMFAFLSRRHAEHSVRSGYVDVPPHPFTAALIKDISTLGRLSTDFFYDAANPAKAGQI